MTKLGKELGVNIVCAQTNYEGEMCELVSGFPELPFFRAIR